MKKLIILLMVGMMIAGCSSKNEGKANRGSKNEDKIAEKDKTKDKNKQSDEIKETHTESKTSEATNNKTTSEPSDNQSVTTNKDSTYKESNTSGNINANQSTPPKEDIPAPPVDPTPAPPTNQSAMADQAFAQINAYRQQNGKAPFTLSLQLKATSEAHAKAMAEKQALWHSDSAECVTNADNPVQAWINSPAHNQMLLCNNTEGAVGIYYYNGYYYSVFQCQW